MCMFFKFVQQIVLCITVRTACPVLELKDRKYPNLIKTGSTNL